MPFLQARGSLTRRVRPLAVCISLIHQPPRVYSQPVSVRHCAYVCGPPKRPPTQRCGPLRALQFLRHLSPADMMGAFAWLEDWIEVMMDKPRGTGTPSVLRSADTTTNTSHRPTTPSHNSVRARHDTRQAHTMIQVESENNKTAPLRSFGTVAAALSQFALLAMALAPSVEASTSSQSSCVQITDTALYSFCASSGRVTSLAFVLEGTTTGTANTVSSRVCRRWLLITWMSRWRCALVRLGTKPLPLLFPF